MLTPDYLDTLPDAVAAELWQQVEDDILRRHRRGGSAQLDELEPLTPTAAVAGLAV